MTSFFVLTFMQVPLEPDLGVDAHRVQKQEQEKIDSAMPLTEEETVEKEDLLNQVCCHGLNTQ